MLRSSHRVDSDTYVRTGLYPSELPVVMGAEGAGRVTAVGEGVSSIVRGRHSNPAAQQLQYALPPPLLRPLVSQAAGDRVGFFEYNSAYTSHAVVSAASCYVLPDGLSEDLAAAALVQGFTAHYLACDTYPLAPGDTALVHAAAGGTGALLVQIAKLRGAFVIGTVSAASKAADAYAAGADEVVVYGGVAEGESYDFLPAVRALCPHGVDVVYDSIGRATACASLEALRPRGTCVLYGNASGAPEPIAPTPTLAKLGSLYVTRPVLEHYLLTAEERARARARAHPRPRHPPA